MKICLIAEGSYPYITGGVSSWIHSLITNMPEHEFVLFTIGASEKQRGKFRYQLPSNLVEIKETFLDAWLREDGSWGRRFRLDDSQRESFSTLLGGLGTLDWSGVFELLRTKRIHQVADFLMSKDYFDVLVELCKEKYNMVPFTEMFWTVRSMVLPLFLTIRQNIPQADIYHSVSTGYAGVVGGLAKHLYGKPFLLTEHGIYSREREEEIIKADWVKGYFKDLWIEYFYRLSGCAYSYADRVVTLFNRNREIEIELGCDEKKIDIIPNGINASDYTDITRLPENGVFRIGAVVRVVPIKDVKSMIQCFAVVKQEVPHAELYIMGPTTEDEEYYSECRQLVESLQVDGIKFTGEVNVREYFGLLDVMLLSSISEGQPLAILEGMAAGIPWVTTDVGSCRELMEGTLADDFGLCGYTVPVMHYEQMAEAIVKLSRNHQMRLKMGLAGKKRAESLYTRERFIENYRSLYARYDSEGVKEWPASALS